jgi:hypothetical protein
MLFPYTYVPHQMEKMQEFIDFIFYEVWCKAPTSGLFGLNLFDANAELREVMETFFYSDSAGADFFYGNVELIHGLFSVLSTAEIAQFQLWYQGNNDIQKVCDNDPTTQLARYTDIAVNHQNIAEQLGNFFKGLYSQSLLNLAVLKEKIGNIDDHYKSFVQINNLGKCPFCGIHDIKGENHSYREAYDHYLPKARYPFNSINFRNLAPACHECNSTYKLSKDPTHSQTGRRKAFYPYAPAASSINMKVDLQHSNIKKLTQADINLQFGPAGINEQIETWKDVYGIEERYKAKLCSADAFDWIEQFRILNRRKRYAARDYLDDIDQSALYANCNFLKKAFMEACCNNGLLTTIENYRGDDEAELER